jgi:hypothetical protein
MAYGFLGLSKTLKYSLKRTIMRNGDVAQMVERSLCMREVRGSIPRISIDLFCISGHFIFSNRLHGRGLAPRRDLDL